MRDLNLIRRNIKHSFRAFQNIRHMPKNIFHILIRGIRHVRKQSERCDVCKIIFPEHPYITREDRSVYRRLRRLKNIFRDAETCRKIIRRPRRDISQRNFTVTKLHSCTRLI